MKPLAVGIIGIGSLGTKRALALGECRLGRLTAVADRDPVKAAEVAAKFGLRSLAVADLLADRSIDVVLVCTPNSSHAALSVTALRAGKHVLCEKPVGCTPQEGAQIVAAVAETGRFFKMGSNHRYFRSVQAAHHLVQTKAIGEVLTMFCRIGHSGDRIQKTWYWDRQQSGGGAMTDTGSHVIDLCRWFMGDFTSCSGAQSQVFWKEANVEDTASGVLVTERGRMAVVTTSRRLFSGYLHIEINGGEGFVWLDARRDTFGVDRLSWSNTANKGAPEVLDFSHDPANSMALELEDFFGSIHARKPLAPSAEDGLAVLRIMSALYTHSSSRIPTS